MPRKPRGQVIERETKRGAVYAIRFHALGRRHYATLGTESEGWTRKRAEVELENVLADVRRGIWRPPEPEPSPREWKPVPSFHEFASQWYEAGSPGWRERTRIDYRWRLSAHLLPHFATYPITAISVEEVDRYRAAKVRESERLAAEREAEAAKPAEERKRFPRPLSHGSINKTIRLLAAILEQAVEYGHLDRNPASGRKRLLRESKPSRSYLQADQVAALLAAAGTLDAEAAERSQGQDSGRRKPLLATLTLAGLRISEALDLRWRDVNLSARRLHVRGAKTDAGVREVDLTPTLAELLTEYRARARFTEDGEHIFATGAGRRDSPENVRTRFLARAVERANASLAEDGGEPIQGATPHALRRTFVSLLLAAGADVPYVMAQAGHSDPKMTLGIYAKVIASATDHGAALDELVRGAEWALMGTRGDFGAQPVPNPDPNADENPRVSGGFEEAADGIRTHDLLHGKQTL
jgi:integrase